MLYEKKLVVNLKCHISQKVQQKLQSDPDNFLTLQSIVLHEVQMEVAQVRNSATEALLWLKRGLKFLKEFLFELDTGEQDIHAALSKYQDHMQSQWNCQKLRSLV